MFNFEDVRSMLEENLSAILSGLDENNDGALSDEANNEKLLRRFPLKLFESFRAKIFDFFDSNKDQSLALDDGFFKVHDRNGDGEVTVRDLREPFHTLYSVVDKDKNEKIGRHEAKDFLKRALNMVDINSDSFIDLNDILVLVFKMLLPVDPAIKWFVRKADLDNDGETTIEEMMEFTDFDIIDTLVYIHLVEGKHLPAPMTAVFDTDGDETISYEEVHGKLEEYWFALLTGLDMNNDGALSDEANNDRIMPRISLKLLELALNKTFDFFDSNKDNSVGLDDAFFNATRNRNDDATRISRDTNQDGEVTLSDVIGKELIALPGPLYALYSMLDEDKNEKLSRDEAVNFMRRTLTVIDSNSDCAVDLNDLLALAFKVSGLDSAMKMFVDKADLDKDGRTTIQEVIKFEDFAFIDNTAKSFIRRFGDLEGLEGPLEIIQVRTMFDLF